MSVETDIPQKDSASGRLSGQTIHTLAVLPFTNASADANVEYLSDGITESLITHLAQLPQLRVMARSTVFRYKGRESDPAEIGRELNVSALLTGRLLLFNERLVISVELVDVKDGAQLWGQQYNRTFSDIFAIQEEVAREITDRLRVQLSAEDEQRLARRYTDDTEAYQDYLKGRFFLNKRTEEGLHRAAEFFQHAIDKDPGYALAWAGMADCYSLLGGYTLMPPAEAFPKAKAAALLALEQNSQLAEAHASLGFIRLRYEWDWHGAEAEFQRALTLNPNYSTAHHWYGTMLMMMGRYAEALEEKRRAQRLDPLSHVIQSSITAIHYFSGQYDKAIELSRKHLTEAPDFFIAHASLGVALLAVGRAEEALAELRTSLELSGGHSEVYSLVGYACAVSGKKTEARRILTELLSPEQKQYVSAYDIATIFTGLRDTEQAFAWLEKAFAERSEGLSRLQVDPAWNPLRSDPRFTEMLRRVGFITEADAVSRAQWADIERVYDEAIALPASERAAFLSRVCAGDEALRREVESLLAAHEDAGSFLERPAARLDSSSPTIQLVREADSLIGRRIAQYQILAKLGAGGMGEVYLAEDTRLHRRIALKLLPAKYAGDAERVRRFEQEARAVSALNHPNIVTLFDLGQMGELYFMATEFVDGRTLREQMRDAVRLPVCDAVTIATQIGQALAAAHEAGIVHRDIKPENVMLRRDGYVKVLDFGLAKLTELPTANRGLRIDEEADTLRQFPQESPPSAVRNLHSTDSGVVMGTVTYMSPEQARGLRVDVRSDVFSLGVVLYEVLTSVRPFAGETASEVLASILRSDPPPLTDHLPDVPEELSRLVLKALEKQPTARYQRIEELLAELKTLAHELEFRARFSEPFKTGVIEDASDAEERVTRQLETLSPAEAAIPSSTSASNAQLSAPSVTPRRVWIRAAASVTLLLLVAGLLVWQRNKPGNPATPPTVQPPRSLAVCTGYKHRVAN